MNFHTWLKEQWTSLLSWFGVEEQKLASFLYPTFQSLKQIVEKDLLKDIIDGVPVIVAALGGGIPAALVAAEQFIVPVLTAQGIELAQTEINVLSNGLVKQAQEAVVRSAGALGSTS